MYGLNRKNNEWGAFSATAARRRSLEGICSPGLVPPAAAMAAVEVVSPCAQRVPPFFFPRRRSRVCNGGAAPPILALVAVAVRRRLSGWRLPRRSGRVGEWARRLHRRLERCISRRRSGRCRRLERVRLARAVVRVRVGCLCIGGVLGRLRYLQRSALNAEVGCTAPRARCTGGRDSRHATATKTCCCSGCLCPCATGCQRQSRASPYPARRIIATAEVTSWTNSPTTGRTRFVMGRHARRGLPSVVPFRGR